MEETRPALDGYGVMNPCDCEHDHQRQALHLLHWTSELERGKMEGTALHRAADMFEEIAV